MGCRGWSLTFALGLAGLVAASSAAAQSAPREATDVYIRRLAGLPAESARGQIEILDVGHGPLETMLSIVARRTATGGRVSYACAASPRCAEGSDRRAATYVLSPQAVAQVDGILNDLRRGGEPDGRAPTTDVIGGYLVVRIDDAGFRHSYRRQAQWGRTLGTLEQLLTPAASDG